MINESLSSGRHGAGASDWGAVGSGELPLRSGGMLECSIIRAVITCMPSRMTGSRCL